MTLTLGWKPDKRNVGLLPEIPAKWLPRHVEDFASSVFTEEKVLLAHPYEVWNQDQTPACVAIAVTTCMEVLDAQLGPSVRLSPLYLYWVARTRHDSRPAITFSTAFSATILQGVCSWEKHPYYPNTEANLEVRPDKGAREDASRRKIASSVVPYPTFGYGNLPTGRSGASQKWKEALAVGMPIAIGIRWTPEYEALSRDNPVYRPAPGQGLGKHGHAVAVIGFDDNDRHFIVKDSQGTGFAKGGFWRMPYEIAETCFVTEAYKVAKITY